MGNECVERDFVMQNDANKADTIESGLSNCSQQTGVTTFHDKHIVFLLAGESDAVCRNPPLRGLYLDLRFRGRVYKPVGSGVALEGYAKLYKSQIYLKPLHRKLTHNPSAFYSPLDGLPLSASVT